MIGRKCGSGLTMSLEGIPPWEASVGGVRCVGNGTKVWRLRWDCDSWGGVVGGPSSYSIDGSKKGSRPAKKLRCIIALAR